MGLSNKFTLNVILPGKCVSKRVSRRIEFRRFIRQAQNRKERMVTKELWLTAHKTITKKLLLSKTSKGREGALGACLREEFGNPYLDRCFRESVIFKTWLLGKGFYFDS